MTKQTCNHSTSYHSQGHDVLVLKILEEIVFYRQAPPTHMEEHKRKKDAYQSSIREKTTKEIWCGYRTFWRDRGRAADGGTFDVVTVVGTPDIIIAFSVVVDEYIIVEAAVAAEIILFRYQLHCVILEVLPFHEILLSEVDTQSGL